MGNVETVQKPDEDEDDDDYDNIIPVKNARSFLTDSEAGCEEAVHLTGDLDDERSPEDDDMCDYHDIPPPPDGGYGWVIVFASFMCNMIVDGIAYTFGVFLLEYVRYFDEGKGKVAWVGSLLSGMYLTAGPVVSALANKFGCRAVCIAGSIISSTAFILSTWSPNVNVLMLTYGAMGGIGFGFIYLPAVVAVGYYFETKRSLATGIAVCGSGFGTFLFAPLANVLLENFTWQQANYILAGLILSCGLFGALMKPLTYPKEKTEKPLMQRMYEEKRLQMERGSIGGSYFMVQLADGTMEKRMKAPINADPGVHSSLNLELMAGQGGMHQVPTLPTISEARTTDSSPEENGIEMKKRPPRSHRTSESSDGQEFDSKNMPRNASQPAFAAQHHGGIPKNGSVPSFDRVRKTSTSERYKPSLSAIKASSRNDIVTNGSNGDEENMFTSKSSLSARPTMVRPLSRKDIFYSSSVTNLPEFQNQLQSQKSLANYRNSQISLTKFEKQYSNNSVDIRAVDVEKTGEKYDLCPCLSLPESFKSAISQMMDVSLLKDPVFMLIGISNVFGMAGLYVPFVYLVDYAVTEGIDKDSASFLISIIGITNTFGRIICGYVADFPKVDSLLLNNLCLVVATIAVTLTPFCNSYAAYVVMSIFFGAAISGYISLTSIILVDLLGLDKLTNAFGLLILFRGAATIVGSPLAGAIYDATGTYAIPFFVAGAFFAISTITSFMAPYMRRFAKTPEPLVHVEVLTPIYEETDDNDEDKPITMVPRIVQTAPSPLNELPDAEITYDKKILENNKKNNEISQMESVL